MSGMNDIRLICNPIQAPSHEFDQIEIKIPPPPPPINVVAESNFVGLLGVREENYLFRMHIHCCQV
jgi:hypothetical protein